MGVSNADGNISDSSETLPKDIRKYTKNEMQDALMKVMTKIFSAKVVIVRLPDNGACKKETDVEKDNSESNESNVNQLKTPNLKDMADMFTKNCRCSHKLEEDLAHNHCRKCKSRFTFRCKKCKKELISYAGMQRHLLTKCNFQGYYYVCPDCPFKSVLRIEVEIHVRNSHPNGRKDKIKIIPDEDVRSNFLKYTCAKCTQEFRYVKSLINHSRTRCSELRERAIDQTFEPESVKIDLSLDEIPDKLLLSTSAKSYCLACDKELSLKDHRSSDQPMCPNCDKNMSFKCSKCARTCKTYSGMVIHLKTKCAAQKNFKCSKCKYTNTSRRSVIFHYKRVHEAIAVECPQCNLKLKSHSVLSCHLKYCNKKPYLSCTFGKCSFITHNAVSLRNHTKRHLRTDNTDCPKCKKKFKNEVVMKNHLFSCGRKPGFFCDNCPYGSKHKRDLQTHMLRVHLRAINNDYTVCPKCNVTFPNKRSNKGHLRLCKTSKPRLQCKYCYYMVEKEKERYFKHHMQSTHPEKLEITNRDSRRGIDSGQDIE